MKKRLQILGIVIVIIPIFQIIGCSTDDNLSKFYTIEKTDIDRPTVRLVWIVVSDTSKLSEINETLKTKYNENRDKYVSFYYLNKKGLSNIDLTKCDTIQFNEYDKHLIGMYSFNPSNKNEGFNKLYENKDWKKHPFLQIIDRG